MSQMLVHDYLNELDRLKKFSGKLTENVVSEAFKDLLKAWAKQQNLHFIAQYEFESPQKNRIRPDGTILHDLRVPLGYWEAKDTADDLEVEISKKFAKGYPQDNIIFENSHTAVLWQNRKEVLRCDMTDPTALEQLVSLFFKWERPEIAEFRKAVAQFKADLPAVLEALRAKIDDAYSGNAPFKAAADAFLLQAKETINPAITEADIREMLIQHILTEEIFAHVFNDGDFHRENNIAKSLYGLEAKFFVGGVKKDTLKALEPYYAAIRANAAQITSHSEKQTFLKVIYENFYKIYNPKAADKLGVVYTPNEIVRFMIDGADWLCQKHFGKALIDRDVEILDPATGTGTFICELLEHFRGQPNKLAYKYKNELHANEVAILPYYVANLNIEATYAAISGQFAEFPNLCFVDTLDNTDALNVRTGQHVGDLLGALSAENVERIRRQNGRKISVVIGNPPYNANQQNENDNNKNRVYAQIDEAIKKTYIKQSTAQKTKLYDMYARFYRWASDRMHEDGVLAFVTNRSFIESRTFDGFRKVVAEEFNEIHIVDLGGDVRANPRLSGTKHNVFGIQTGVAICFLVKRRKQKGCKIFYVRRPEMETAEDKLAWLGTHRISALPFQYIKPNIDGSWINLSENNWSALVSLIDKKTKASKRASQQRSIFALFASGIKTNRDEWVYDLSCQNLADKASSLIGVLDSARIAGVTSTLSLAEKIKISSSLRIPTKKMEYNGDKILDVELRAFVSGFFYSEKALSDRLTSFHFDIFGSDLRKENQIIAFRSVSSNDSLAALASIRPIDYSYIKTGNGGTETIPRYRYSMDGERIDNITDWGLKQFTAHYPKDKLRPITKDAIFHYVYGVLHDPIYRETYAEKLKRELPRIPFYADFWQWAEWGEQLMALHIGYETVEPWPLDRLDTPDKRARAAGQNPKPMLKSDHGAGTITLDSETQLTGIPPAVWNYRLGNRTALDWILDQYKEKTPKDPTIREKFNTYRFADYKEKVVDLLMRVTRVSVETVAIVEAMRHVPRDAPNDPEIPESSADEPKSTTKKKRGVNA